MAALIALPPLPAAPTFKPSPPVQLPPHRPMRPPQIIKEGWLIDIRDLCVKPFPIVVTPEMVPGLTFDHLIAKGVDGCVYAGNYQGKMVAIKIGISISREVETIKKLDHLGIAPLVYHTAEFKEVFHLVDGKLVPYTDPANEDVSEPSGDDDLAGVEDGLAIIVMERFDMDLDQLSENPALVAEHGAKVYAALESFLNGPVTEHRVYHEDLKLQNIVVKLGPVPVIRLVDFLTTEIGDTELSEIAEYKQFLADVARPALTPS